MDKANVRSWQGLAPCLKVETYTPYLAYRDHTIHANARIFVALLVGYAFSLTGPIPGFILVVGLLYKMPQGVILARKIIPGQVLHECRERSREVMREGQKPIGRGAAVVLAVWLLQATLGGVLAFRIAQGFGS